MKKQGKKIIHLEVGEPDFKPPEEVKTALEEVYDKGYGKYGSPKGITELRQGFGKVYEKWKAAKDGKRLVRKT